MPIFAAVCTMLGSAVRVWMATSKDMKESQKVVGEELESDGKSMGKQEKYKEVPGTRYE